jgi:hypothetical protein
MLAQVDLSSSPPVTRDLASSGVTVQTSSVTSQPSGAPPAEQAPARTAEGHGPTPAKALRTAPDSPATQQAAPPTARAQAARRLDPQQDAGPAVLRWDAP